MSREETIGVIFAYLTMSFLLAFYNGAKPDCKTRYIDFVFPARRIGCEVFPSGDK